MSKTSVDLQSNNFTLLVIHIYTTCLDEIRKTLEEKITKAPYFLLKNTPTVINVSHCVNHNNWFNLYRTILNIGLFVIGVCYCNDDKLKETITRSGLPILITKDTSDYKNFVFYKQNTIHNTNKIITYTTTQLINKPIRSGQKIYARNSDLIVTSHISSGAEIIADGNIHIYGIMRGRALAGASGRKEAQIFCTHLFPELISIGGHYWLIDQIPKEFLGKSVRLSLKKDTLTIQYL